MNPPTRADICKRLRELQESEGEQYTDAEVQGILCTVLNETRSVPFVEDWEDLVVRYAARVIRERDGC